MPRPHIETQHESEVLCRMKARQTILYQPTLLLKVQFRRKKLGNKVQAKSSNLPRRFCSNSVGTPLEFAAFRSGFYTKHSRASAFWFFLSTTMVFTAFRTHFARKNTSIFMLIGSLSRGKK